MHSTFGQVIRRRFRRLITSPKVTWPLAMGGMFAYWCNNGIWNNWDATAWVMIGLGLSTAIYRCTLGGRQHEKQAREDLRNIAKRQEKSSLEKLKRAMLKARDPRLGDALKKLTKAYDRLQQVDRWRCDGATGNGMELAEVHDQACRLYIECRNLLERSHELFDGANQMATEMVRDRVLASREELLAELQTSQQQLDHALDEVYSSQLSGKVEPIAEASELRDELSRQVEVARHVEERMETLAGEIREARSLE